MSNSNKDHTAFFLSCLTLGKSSYVSVSFLVKDEYNKKSESFLLNQEESMFQYFHILRSRVMDYRSQPCKV